MPFTASFNSFMAKKKRRGGSTDELALAKAAAWAWYQHGSGSEGRPIGEFNMRRTQQVPRPSRYKLEAMRSTGSPLIHAEDNSLLDTHEIESISKRIDELIIEESGNRLYKKKVLVSDHHDDNRKKDSTISENKKRSKKLIGFWPLRHAILCGTRQDAVVTRRAFAADHHHQQPEKRATVVKFASCRPRVSHA